MKNYSATVEALYDRYPQLRSPAPPAPVATPSPLVSAQELFAPIASQVRAGTYLLREAAPTPHGLVGPYLVEHDCLDPLIPADASAILAWFDPQLPATDGDVVLVLWDQSTLDEVVLHPGVIAVKMLRHLSGKHRAAHVITARDGMVLLGGNRILGVLRYLLIDAGGECPGFTPAYGSGADSQGWSHLDQWRESSGGVSSERL